MLAATCLHCGCPLFVPALSMRGLQCPHCDSRDVRVDEVPDRLARHVR